MKHTQFRISKSKLLHNFNYYKSKLLPSTKILILVKANGYGLGDIQMASLAQEFGADYLGVAFIAEGITLREAGITLPIIVFTPGVDRYDQLIEYNLEPSIINKETFDSMVATVKKANLKEYPVHIKLDTGMQRVGFDSSDMKQLKTLITANHNLKIKSLFSHLATADDSNQDDFTREQIELFCKMSYEITSLLDYVPMRHILNSPGVDRFTYAQMDMVRIGMGLYGASCLKDAPLKNVASYVSPIIFVKEVKGGSVGYGRRGVVDSTVKKIATVPVGYADGVDRHLGKGKMKFYVNGVAVPTIGDICMDTLMLDITGTDIKIGDEVTLFGENPHPAELANELGTIIYEIFTSVSSRIDRVITE